MFCMYLVDLVAVSLVSCMVMIVGGFGEYVVSSCRHGIAVLSEAAFQVMMCGFLACECCWSWCGCLIVGY